MGILVEFRRPTPDGPPPLVVEEEDSDQPAGDVAIAATCSKSGRTLPLPPASTGSACRSAEPAFDVLHSTQTPRLASRVKGSTLSPPM